MLGKYDVHFLSIDTKLRRRQNMTAHLFCTPPRAFNTANTHARMHAPDTNDTVVDQQNRRTKRRYQKKQRKTTSLPDSQGDQETT